MRERTQNIAGVSPLVSIPPSLDAYKTLAAQKGVSFSQSAAPAAVVSPGGLSSGIPVPSPVFPRFGKAHELTDVALAELVRQRFGVELGARKPAAISATLPPQIPPQTLAPQSTSQPSQAGLVPQANVNTVRRSASPAATSTSRRCALRWTDEEEDSPPARVGMVVLGGEPEQAGEPTAVRPVQVGGGPVPMMGPYMAYGGPLGNLYHASAKEMPVFNGRNYNEFQRQWPLWLQQQASFHGPLADEVKLRLFESATEEGVRCEIQRQRERGEVVKYQQVYSWFMTRYGGDMEGEAVSDLKSLKLQYEGKLTRMEFIPFVQNFRLKFERQDTIPLEEAVALLLAQVPENMRRRVLDEQTRRSERDPKVRVAGVLGVSVEDVREFVTRTLARRGCPTDISVTTKGEQYIVGVANKAAMDALIR